MNLDAFKIAPFDASTRAQYLDLVQYCFDMPDWGRDRYFSRESDYPQSLGVWDGDRLACGMWYWSYDMRVRGILVPMAGVAAVGTWPEYRNRGLVRLGIRRLQEMMRDQRRPVSVLAPFKWSFYRDLGWAPTFEVLRLHFEPARLKRFQETGCTVREVNGVEEWQEFEMLNSRYGERYNGPVCRDEWYWRTRYFDHPETPRKAYLVERDGASCGYLITRFVPGTGETGPERLSVLQAVWLDGAALRTILSFLRSLRDQVKFIRLEVPPDLQLVDLFDDPRIEMRLEAKMMTKIIDIRDALERIPFAAQLDGSLVLTVEADASAPWTGGTWQLQFKGGKVHVAGETAPDGAARTSIQALSQMYMGYRTATALVDAGELEATPEQVSILEQAFPRYPTYIDDWF